MRRERIKPEHRAILAAMLGLPPKYACRAARVLELWEPQINFEAQPSLVRLKDVAKLLAPMGKLKKEHLVGLYLNAQNKLLHKETISIGSLNTTRSTPREIFYPAITHLALGLILVHNHPSGSLDPSDEDVAFTRAIARAGEMLGIELFDHLILSSQGYTSLRERGAF